MNKKIAVEIGLIALDVIGGALFGYGLAQYKYAKKLRFFKKQNEVLITVSRALCDDSIKVSNKNKELEEIAQLFVSMTEEKASNDEMEDLALYARAVLNEEDFKKYIIDGLKANYQDDGSNLDTSTSDGLSDSTSHESA